MKVIVKLCLIISVLIVLMVGVVACMVKHSPPLKVGVILPLEHKAMNDIVDGFTQTLKSLYLHPIEIKIANAQNDPNLLRAIIQQLRDDNTAIIVPIGTNPTQMTLSMIHNKPIVSLASVVSDNDRHKLKECNVALVHDEISSYKLIQFIHEVYPSLKVISLVHSASEKIFPQVTEIVAAGKEKGIHIIPVMAATLPELASVVSSISPDTQAIFILKDSLMASGVATLTKEARLRHIPLITSDQDSVQEGAGFSLGVHEREIGVLGAKLANAVLQGKSACSLPVADMENLTVFINKKSLQAESLSIEPLVQAAKTLHYTIEFSHNEK